MLYFYHEEGMNRYRVWCHGWATDQFEVLTPFEFVKLQATVAEWPRLMTLIERFD